MSCREPLTIQPSGLPWIPSAQRRGWRWSRADLMSARGHLDAEEPAVPDVQRTVGYPDGRPSGPDAEYRCQRAILAVVAHREVQA